MRWTVFGTATTDAAFTLVPRPGQTYGIWRHRANAERCRRELPGSDWPVVETTFSGRCDDEFHETLESEWQQ